MPESDCPLCGGEGWIIATDESGREFVRPCGCASAARRRDALEAAHIPERYAHCILDNFSGALTAGQKKALE
ncbi:MAG TPA: AAA family ATPase, partial [Candidatus Coatesbacteria bacterium]|nr:AAA family ATPase [Candidatus Coatesbacteria bacterium]